jgi:hypothetical protein
MQIIKKPNSKDSALKSQIYLLILIFMVTKHDEVFLGNQPHWHGVNIQHFEDISNWNVRLLLHIDVVDCPRHAYIDVTTLTLSMLKSDRIAVYNVTSSSFLLTER